ncbi:hypothetical protein N665_0071s0041 [Sinapis alba]|nr:hypothetical protein N665_0071s0041 [Sinapis alba]
MEDDCGFQWKDRWVVPQPQHQFENLNTHVKKLENQVMQTSETFRRHESLIKEKIEAGQKHHVNALIDDDFWIEVKKERLQEEDFCVENSIYVIWQFALVSIDTEQRASIDNNSCSISSFV